MEEELFYAMIGRMQNISAGIIKNGEQSQINDAIEYTQDFIRVLQSGVDKANAMLNDLTAAKAKND